MDEHERKARAKAQDEFRNVWEVIGWETILHRALENKWFSGAEKTEFESVWASDFEELVKLNSISGAFQ